MKQDSKLSEGDMVPLAEAIIHSLQYYSIRAREAVKSLNQIIKDSPTIYIKEKDVFEGKASEILFLHKEGEFSKYELLGALELYLNILETNSRNRKVLDLIGHHSWACFKTCLFISHEFFTDKSWTLSSYLELTVTDNEDLKRLQAYFLADVLNFELGLGLKSIKKTEQFLEGIQEFLN